MTQTPLNNVVPIVTRTFSSWINVHSITVLLNVIIWYFPFLWVPLVLQTLSNYMDVLLVIIRTHVVMVGFVPNNENSGHLGKKVNFLIVGLHCILNGQFKLHLKIHLQIFTDLWYMSKPVFSFLYFGVLFRWITCWQIEIYCFLCWPRKWAEILSSGRGHKAGFLFHESQFFK